MKKCILLSKNDETRTFFIELIKDINLCDQIGEIYNRIVESVDDRTMCDFHFVKLKILEHPAITEIEFGNDAESLTTIDIQIEKKWFCYSIKQHRI